MCVVCPSVVGLVVVVVMGVVGRISCLILLLRKSLYMESHSEASCAAVSHVVSFGVLYPFCLVDIAGFLLDFSFVQRPSRCWAIILACPKDHALSEDPRRDFISCHQVVCFVSCSHHVVDPWLQFVFCSSFGTSPKEKLLSASWLLSVVLAGVVEVKFCRVVLQLPVEVVEFAVGDFVDVRGVCGCETFS